MQTVKAFLDQALLVWKESTAAARVGILLLALMCIGAIIGVGFWSAQPNYVTLASNLDHVKSTQLMAALDQANIAYQIKGAGSMILVDKRAFDRAAALAGSRGIGVNDVELESSSPWLDPVNQQQIYRRNLEKQLAHSIQKYSSIESAVVHLSIPERQPFLRPTAQPSASVVLSIVPNQRFTEAQAVAIAQLIANAVPGLRMEQVAISDTSGNLYSHDEALGRLTKQEEYRLNRERELTHKAQSLLINFLGIGNSRVEITTDFSFPEGRTTITEFDPDKRVATSETIDTSTTTGEGGSADPGSNAVGTAGAPRSNKSLISKTEVVNNKYEVSSTHREDIVRTPVLNVLTVSVLVNSAKVANENKEIPASVKTSIEAMVKQAVGFRDGVDQFNLEFFEFVELLPEVNAPATFPWKQIHTMVKNLSLGLAAVAAVYLGLRTFKHLQPVPRPTNSSFNSFDSRDARLSQLSEMIRQHPEEFSRVLAAWASENQSPEKPLPTKKAA